MQLKTAFFIITFAVTSHAASSGGNSAPAFSAGANYSPGSGELKIPCGGGIYQDCATVLSLVQNKIKLNAYEAAKSLTENSIIPKSIDPTSGTLTGTPFPRAGVKVCPLTDFNITHYKIKSSPTDSSLEMLGDEVSYGSGKAVSKTDFVSKCGPLAYGMFDGALGAGVAGGLVISYAKAAREVATQASASNSEITFKLLGAKCNQKTITDRYSADSLRMQNMKNKDDIASKCGPNVSDKARGLCSDKHYFMAAYTALLSAMAQMGACELQENAMKKYTEYKKYFNGSLKNNVSKACNVVITSTSSSEVDKCFAASMYDRIKCEQNKIEGRSPCL